MQIQVTPLGAGQDVGRSCILANIGGTVVMFDCGLHMGFNDDRRIPDFKHTEKFGKPLSQSSGSFWSITLFHRAIWVGPCAFIFAICYFELICRLMPINRFIIGRYSGPIYMTFPTKAIVPLLLEDYAKILERSERKSATGLVLTQKMISDCMKKVTPIGIRQPVRLSGSLEIKAYYAGHVLGAAMFEARVGDQSVLYTGDYNMSPDRHLGAAMVDTVQPTLLITESTYCTTVRDSRRVREREFLLKVRECIDRGGKVLIPVFALGRAQELSLLVDTYWDRMNLDVPVYVSSGLAKKANFFYDLFIGWTSQRIKEIYSKRNVFEYKHISVFDRSVLDAPGPVVLFASPGMLHAGFSLEVFKRWCGSELNMCILAGYCVSGTVGAKLLSGAKKLEIDDKPSGEINCEIVNYSFSAHADAKGAFQLIQNVKPRNVMLVHGERNKMFFAKQRIQELGIDCYVPKNGQTVVIDSSSSIPAMLSGSWRQKIFRSDRSDQQLSPNCPPHKQARSLVSHAILSGVLVLDDQDIKILQLPEASSYFGLPAHRVTYTTPLPLPLGSTKLPLETMHSAINSWLDPEARLEKNCLRTRSVCITYESSTTDIGATISWDYQDEDYATHVLSVLRTALVQIQQ